jgi:hypothetical protein
MAHPAIKIEATAGTEPQSPDTQPSLNPRIARAHVRTLPPPPPLAAFASRLPEEPAARTALLRADSPTLAMQPAPQASLAPLPEAAPLPMEERFELDLAPNPQFAVALSQPPLPKKTPWLRIVGTAIGAAALLSTGYLAATLRMHTPVTVTGTVASPSPTLDHASERAAEPAAVASAVANAPAERLEQQPPAPISQALPAANSVAGAAHTASTTSVAAARSASAAERRALDAPPTMPEPSKPDSVLTITPRAGDTEPHSNDSQTNDSPAQESSPVASHRESSTPRVRPPADSVAHVAPARDPVPELLAPNTGLPTQPTRDQVKQSLQQIEPALLTCSAGVHGTVFANVTVASSGRVSHGSIEGDFAGTPQGSCMARALRTAAFPAFSAQSFSVKYPFRL